MTDRDVGRRWLRSLLAVAVLVVLAAGAAAETAQPAYPGKNGVLAVQFGYTVGGVPGCIDECPMRTALVDPSSEAVGVVALKDAVIGVGQQSEPAWSPNGKRYAFSRPNGFGLYVANADGTDKKTLVELPLGPSLEQPYLYRSPSWSPDGRRIAYVREGAPGPGAGPRKDQIRSMTPSGTGDKLIWEGFLSSASEYVWIDEVAWSPDGKRLAATIREKDSQTDSFDLFVIGVDGTMHKQLTSSTANESAPEWSPDGRKIAFVRGQGNDSEIHVVGADGSSPSRLTDNDDRDQDPAWSPDGGKIAFVSDRDRSGTTNGLDAYVMNANGSGVERLTIGGRAAPNILNTNVRTPSWRPIDVKPTIRGLTATPPLKTLVSTKPKGVVVTFRLSEIATVEIVLTSTTDTDVKRTHRVDGKAGLNSVTLGSSVIRGLMPGRYTVTVTARDPLGNRSAPANASLTLPKL